MSIYFIIFKQLCYFNSGTGINRRLGVLGGILRANGLIIDNNDKNGLPDMRHHYWVNGDYGTS